MNNIAQTQTENRPRVGLEPERDYLAPPADIHATDDEYLIELEMPGVNKTGIEVSVEGNELTIVGHRQKANTSGHPFYCESVDADYCRTFALGPDVDSSKIKAEMQDGILRLHLPKAEKVKPRKIDVVG